MRLHQLFQLLHIGPLQLGHLRKPVKKNEFLNYFLLRGSMFLSVETRLISTHTCSFFFRKMKVGMAVILYSAATSSTSSTSTFHQCTQFAFHEYTQMNRDRKTKFTLRKTTSSSVLLNSSRTGAIILQGPHLKFCSKSTQSQCGTIATRWQKSQPPPASPQQL